MLVLMFVPCIIATFGWMDRTIYSAVGILLKKEKVSVALIMKPVIAFLLSMHSGGFQSILGRLWLTLSLNFKKQHLTASENFKRNAKMKNE